MLLAIDVGNTQTVLGLYDGETLRDHWRVATEPHRSGDELGALLEALLPDLDGVDGVASRRPCRRSSARTRSSSARFTSGASCSSLGPGIKTGIAIRYDDPREVGPDRIANAVAAKSATARRRSSSTSGRRRTSTSSPRRASASAACSRRGSRSRWTRSSRARRGSSAVDFSAPPSVIGKTTVGVAAVRPRLRLHRPGGRDRDAHPRRARRRRAGDRDRRSRRADRAALADDQRVDPVAHARGPAARLGAERD